MNFSEVTPRQRTLLLLNTVALQLTTIVSFSVMWNLTQNKEWDNLGTWHIFLCTIGFGTLMTKALMVFNEYNVPSLGHKRVRRGKSHSIVMAIGFILLTIGISLKICQKSEHFTSNHGKLGLTSWILSALAIIDGILMKNSAFVRPVLFKFCHNFTGIFGYLIGIMAMGYGIKDYLGYNTGTATSMIVMLSFCAVYALRPPVLSLWNQAKDLKS